MMENIDVSCDYPEQVKQKLLFHSNLLEAVNDSLVVAGVDGKITYWNKGSERLFGWLAEEIIGQPFSRLFGNDAQEIPTHINEIHKGFWTGKIPILTKAGEKRYVNVSVSAMDNHQNKPSYLVAVISDITELMEFRIEAEEALRSKEEFLANISHEIRTPMAGILGYVELLTSLVEDDIQRHYLNAIRENSNQLLDLINDILDLSKIDANKILIEQNNFNLLDLINSVVKIFTPAINAKKLDLLVEIDPELPLEIVSDSVRVKQILSNLLSNAVKFTPQGQIIILARKGNLLENNQFELIIEVVDTGIGIPASKLTTVFEPFTQADSSTTRKYGGTGLGLSITKKLVNILNGEVTVESIEGNGSKFKFIMPVSEANHRYELPSSVGINLDYTCKLLLISPSNNLFEFLSEALANVNIKLIWVENDKRLTSIISFHEPEILVIDCVNIGEEINLKEIDEKIISLPHIVYALTNQPAFPEIIGIDKSTVKVVISLDSLVDELVSTSIVKPSTPLDNLIRILLIDENRINSLLIKNFLENEKYMVNVISDLSELSLLKETSFHIVLVDGELIEKYDDKLFEKLSYINYSTLIGIVNINDNINKLFFNDFIYKPVTTDNLLSTINYHYRGMQE